MADNVMHILDKYTKFRIILHFNFLLLTSASISQNNLTHLTVLVQFYFQFGTKKILDTMNSKNNFVSTKYSMSYNFTSKYLQSCAIKRFFHSNWLDIFKKKKNIHHISSEKPTTQQKKKLRKNTPNY